MVLIARFFRDKKDLLAQYIAMKWGRQRRKEILRSLVYYL